MPNVDRKLENINEMRIDVNRPLAFSPDISGFLLLSN